MMRRCLQHTWTVNGITQPGNRHEVAGNIWGPRTGVYQLTVQEHANNGCDGDIRTGTVYVMHTIANAGPDAIVCYMVSPYG